MPFYRRIGRPLEAHNVASPEAYRLWQAGVIASGRQARPALYWPDPHVSPAAVEPRISGGVWVVLCPCGNAPVYDPEWQLACCPDCGAIYVDVVPPADWAAIESVLMARPSQATRHWLPDETLEQLRAENLEHGVGV